MHTKTGEQASQSRLKYSCTTFSLSCFSALAQQQYLRLDIEKDCIRNTVRNDGLFKSNSTITNWKIKIRSNEVTSVIVFGILFFFRNKKVTKYLK